MLTPAPATHDFSDFIAHTTTAAADRHVEQAELLEDAHENEAYFDVIMRVRRNRPASALSSKLARPPCIATSPRRRAFIIR
jgi:hypothetical protein